MDYSFLKDIPGTNPKPTPRKKLKAKAKREKLKGIAAVRQYVFARERDLCRCCRKRKAESLHEMIPRGRGGKVSKRNSIAVCGQLVGTEECCHTYLQQNAIIVRPLEPFAEYGEDPNAEKTLTFHPRTRQAIEWMGLESANSTGLILVSPPMVETEQE